MLSPARCAAPLRQALRRADGVRGVFARGAVPRGALLLAVPTRYCFFPDGLPSLTRHTRHARQQSASLSCAPDVVRRSQQLRRCHGAAALFPEASTWLRRLCADAPHDRVSLEASASLDPLLTTLDAYDDDDAAAGAHGRQQQRRATVVTVTVSPVEAALAVCVALRYFFAHTAALSASARAQLRVGPSPCDVRAEQCVRALPMTQYIEHGVEAAYAGGDDDAEAHTHTCLEQVAHNLRDAVLTYASASEYGLFDRHASELDAVLLSALYVVRARVLRLPWLVPLPASCSSSSNSGSSRRCCSDGNTQTANGVQTCARDAACGSLHDGRHRRRHPLRHRPSHSTTASVCTHGADDATFVRVFAPGVYALNHSSTPTAAAVVSPAQGMVVVRALQPLRIGDELTLDYKAHMRHGEVTTPRHADGGSYDAAASAASLYDGDNMSAFDGSSDDGDDGVSLDDKDWWESRYLLNDAPPPQAA